MASEPLTAFRKEYLRGSLNREDLDSDPVRQLRQWLEDARGVGHGDPYAMTLATADGEGVPDARMVLLKDLDDRGIVFCTNYTSPKGREIAENPRAAAVFYWPELERQVRLAGTVEKTSVEESDRHFQARPREARIAALASRQSSVLAGREVIEARVTELTSEFEGREIPVPETWGGYLIRPEWIEFWQGGQHRLHDRFRYSRSEAGWVIERLSP